MSCKPISASISVLPPMSGGLKNPDSTVYCKKTFIIIISFIVIIIANFFGYCTCYICSDAQ